MWEKELLWKCNTISTFDTSKTVVSKLNGLVSPFSIYLDGEIGGGKTTVCKSIGKFYGFSKIISSSFSKVSYHQNSNKKDLIHCDFYNVVNQSEFFYSEVFDNITSCSIFLSEWSSFIYELKMQQFYMKIITTGDFNRNISFYMLHSTQ